MTDQWQAASPEAQELASEYYEIDLAEMLVAAQATLARIAALAEEHPAGIDTALIHEALDQPAPGPTENSS